MEQRSWFDRPPGPRSGGVIWLGTGLLASYLGLLSPYLSDHSPSYWPHLLLAATGPLLLVVGVSFLVAGEKAVQIIGDPRKPLRWVHWLSVPLVAAGVLLFLWLRLRHTA